MLLGDLVASLDNEYVAEEVLMALEDLALIRRASDAAREDDLDLGSFVSIAVRRYLNQAPPRRVDVLDERDGTLRRSGVRIVEASVGFCTRTQPARRRAPSPSEPITRH